MDRLDALRIKYARAQEHRAAWDGALDNWVATMPYGVRGEADPTGWFVTRLRGSHGQNRQLKRPACASTIRRWRRSRWRQSSGLAEAGLG